MLGHGRTDLTALAGFSRQPVPRVGDMRALPPPSDGVPFDAVTCVGNTLVHLADRTEITGFFRQALARLRPGGVLVVQVICYDRILRLRPHGLPTIETKALTFERQYAYPPDEAHIRFQTRLRVKATGDLLENTVLLYPATRAELLAALREAGFVRLATYAGPGAPRWQPSS